MTDPDVAAGLSDLERKLAALEQELKGSRRSVAVKVPANGGTESPGSGPAWAATDGESPFSAALGTVAEAPAPEEPPAAAPSTPAEPPAPPHAFVAAPPPPPSQANPQAPEPLGEDGDDTARVVGDARHELGGLHAHLDELERFREQLERSAQELMAEYDRLLVGLRATAEREQSATGSPAGLDAAVLDGMLTVDAGPFADIATLAELEQALGGLPGVRDVHVRTFERSHALIDVILGEPIAFGTALRRSSTLVFSVTRAIPGHVTIALG